MTDDLVIVVREVENAGERNYIATCDIPYEDVFVLGRSLHEVFEILATRIMENKNK